MVVFDSAPVLSELVLVFMVELLLHAVKAIEKIKRRMFVIVFIHYCFPVNDLMN